MHGTITDTGWEYPAPSLPLLNPTGERALRKRVWLLDAEIAAGAWEHEQLCKAADATFERLIADMESRRQIRDVLFMRGQK